MHQKRRLCHTDLKPENILLVSTDYDVEQRESRKGKKEYRIPRSDRIKLIDFGRSTYSGTHTPHTPHTRAPARPHPRAQRWHAAQHPPPPMTPTRES